jgi:hypothetical protein
MPAVSQPGSRAGLISAMVVAVVVALIMTVMFFVANADAKANLQKREQLSKAYAKVLAERDLNVAWIREMEEKASSSGTMKPIAEILHAQRQNLIQTITGGTNVSAEEAAARAKAAVSSEELKKTGVSVPGGSLIGAISALTGQLNQKNAEIAGLNQQLAAAGKAFEDEKKAHTAQLEEVNKAIAAADAKASELAKALKDYQDGQDANLRGLEGRQKTQIEDYNKLLTAMKEDADKRSAEVGELQKKLKTAIDVIKTLKPTGTADATLRRPDGKIIQVARDNIVYINLGQGQQVHNGMTFEVYDQHEGIPRVGDGTPEDQLPKGKGSIEVIAVSPGSSKCRIVKTEPGQQLFDGDIIANLVYDQNLKMRFHVYGEFDIDQNNVANAREADIVKRLITQWGGVVTEKVDMDVDILVMGKEPPLPEKPKPDPATGTVNPADDLIYQQAQQKLDAYLAVRDQAISYGIPVLNQNRFLHYIGYFDQAKK